MKNSTLTFSIFIIAILILSSCKPPPPAEEIYWPPAPQTPKIQFVKTIYGKENIKRSFWGKIRDFFVGKGDSYLIGKPYGTFYDGKSKLYVVDTSKKGVLVFDFSNGEVYRYNIDDKNWNPETQVCQAFLCGKGHNTDRCTWMVGSEDKFNINPNRI